MSVGSYVGRIGSLSVHPRGSGAAVSGLLVLGALLALLVAAWGVAFGAGTTELDRADARLASEVRAASAGFSGLVAAADARAGSLAASPALQRAVLSRNRRNQGCAPRSNGHRGIRRLQAARRV